MPGVVDPRVALLWFAIGVAILAVLFWPRRGLVSWLAGRRNRGERILSEDALKHLLNCELGDERASVTTLAGSLEIPRARADALAARIETAGFATADARGLVLTEAGRAYALRVLRSHRLLERFFADRTSLPPEEWHDRAEVTEHRISATEVERLAARMGDPHRDPHGDPIPTAEGRLPASVGLPLASLPIGATATVTHLEDEPEPVFERLVGLGFHPATPVKLVGRSAGELELLVGGEPVTLGLREAGAVTVELVPEAAGHTVFYERLDALRPGERAKVVEIAPAVQGTQRRRLLDLGVLPGTEIAAEITSPAGDPRAYRIRGALIALRRRQAQGIYISRIHAGEGGPALDRTTSGAVA